MTSAFATPNDAPPRGTRPGNRRDLIRRSAARLFYDRGYAQVSVAEIGRSVNVTPAAIYRHYAHKADILMAVVEHSLDAFATMVEDAASQDADDLARGMARAALDHRNVGVLFQRDARNLSPTQRNMLARRTLQSYAAFGVLISTDRRELDPAQAELLAACAINAMTSISFHRLELPRAEFEDVLTSIFQKIYRANPSADRTVDTSGPPVVRGSRRRQLLDHAMTLFAANGYPAVSVDDIGAGAGIAGPSVYNHFASKQALLWAAFSEGHEQLREIAANAMAVGPDEPHALREISDGYVDVVFDNAPMMATLITESSHLDPDKREWTRRAQLDFIGEIVSLRRAVHPDESPIAARLAVQAAQMVANNVARLSRARSTPGVRATVKAVCWEILR